MLRNKKIIVEINHPKHFYQFKPLINVLCKNNKVQIISRDKDVVIDLLNESRLEYKKFGLHSNRLIYKILITPLILIDYIKIIVKFKPDIVISRSSHYSIILGKVFNFKIVVFPDAEIVPIINKFVGPNADLVITPSQFNLRYGDHHKVIDGFFEETYLAPNIIKKNMFPIESLNLDKNEVFFVVRFIKWGANHDYGQHGFNENEKDEILTILQTFGKVIVSIEGKAPYMINSAELIHPSQLHILLHNASLYVGDSQSMATEAALLGTPSFRYNSFVGTKDMKNFRVLEDKGLMRNYYEFKNLKMDLTKSLTRIDYHKKLHQDKIQNYFENKIDVTEQSLNILNSYPFIN